MTTKRPPNSSFTPSRWRRVFSSLLVLAAFIAVLGAIASWRQPAIAALGDGTGAFQSSKIAPWVLEHTANKLHNSVDSFLAIQVEGEVLFLQR